MQMADKGEKLLPCPFCGGEMQLRYALWPSEGDRDAVIHAQPTNCPIEGAFSIDTFDNGVSVAEAWNNRSPSTSTGESDWVLVQQLADWLAKRGEPDSGISYSGPWSDEVLGRQEAQVRLFGTDATFIADHFHGPGARKLAAALRAMLASAPAPDTKQEADERWRDLALQFDGHRIEALSLLRYVSESRNCAEATSRASEIKAFLSKPPLSGEAVLAQRLTALAPASEGYRGEFKEWIADDMVTAAWNITSVAEGREALRKFARSIRTAPAPDTMQEPVAFADPRDIGKNFFSVFRAATALYTIPLYPSPVATGTAEGVRVKPLVWREYSLKHEYGAGSWEANGAGLSHTYAILDVGSDGKNGARYYWQGRAQFDTLDEAKAAAQQDYEARIRSALFPSPVTQKVSEATELVTDAAALRVLRSRPFGDANIAKYLGLDETGHGIAVMKRVLTAALSAPGETR